jgi:alpha-tubulin suppressor-like RCC1 family protein
LLSKSKSTLDSVQQSYEQETHCRPRQVIFNYPGIEVTKVVCGNTHTLALTKDGDVYSWGFGTSGCLGLGPEIAKTAIP